MIEPLRTRGKAGESPATDRWTTGRAEGDSVMTRESISEDPVAIQRRAVRPDEDGEERTEKTRLLKSHVVSLITEMHDSQLSRE